MHFAPIFWRQKLQSCVLGLKFFATKILAKKPVDKKGSKSKNLKKVKTIFDTSEETSDFLSCDSSLRTAQSQETSTDFSFSFKHKAEEKENSFDKYLFNF